MCPVSVEPTTWNRHARRSPPPLSISTYGCRKDPFSGVGTSAVKRFRSREVTGGRRGVSHSRLEGRADSESSGTSPPTPTPESTSSVPSSKFLVRLTRRKISTDTLRGPGENPRTMGTGRVVPLFLFRTQGSSLSGRGVIGTPHLLVGLFVLPLTSKLVTGSFSLGALRTKRDLRFLR